MVSTEVVLGTQQRTDPSPVQLVERISAEAYVEVRVYESQVGTGHKMALHAGKGTGLRLCRAIKHKVRSLEVS